MDKIEVREVHYQDSKFYIIGTLGSSYTAYSPDEAHQLKHLLNERTEL